MREKPVHFWSRPLSLVRPGWKTSYYQTSQNEKSFSVYLFPWPIKQIAAQLRVPARKIEVS
jgi:hypothetical protein